MRVTLDTLDRVDQKDYSKNFQFGKNNKEQQIITNFPTDDQRKPKINNANYTFEIPNI